MSLLFLQQWFSEQVLKAIGWTLVHSLWQGLLAAVLTGVIIIGTRRSKARLRYNLFGSVLCLFVITTIITFSLLLKSGPTAVIVLNNGAAVNPTDVIAIHVSGISSGDNTTAIDRFVGYFDRNADLFVMIWAFFFFIHCIKLGTGLAGVHRVRSYKVFEAAVEWSARLGQLCKVVGVKETVQLLESGLVKVPVAMGIFKPVILVPLGLLSHLPPSQVETILLHELAHIRRKDYIVNILQRFTEAVFFFNPALLWISSLIRQEREACCDDMVIAHATHKESYLEALVSFQEYSLTATGYAMAIGSKRNFLLNRVKRMITHENQKLKAMEKLFLTMGLIAITAFTFIPKDQPANKTIAPAVQSSSIIQQVAGTPAETIVQGNKAVVRKENDRIAYKVRVNAAPADTVPSKKEKEKARYEDLRFPSISSNINDDGKTKTENIAVTDQDGRKYSYTKLNGKLTSLSIDGKSIPESEFDNYSPLIDQIERSLQERQLMKLKELAVRRMTLEKKSEDRRNELMEKKLMNQFIEKKLRSQAQMETQQRKFLLEKNSQLNGEQRKNLENKLKETKKLLRQLKEKRMVPMVDGREVSKINGVPAIIMAEPAKISACPVNVKPVSAALIKRTGLIKPIKHKLSEKPMKTSTPVKPIFPAPKMSPVKQQIVT